MSDREQIDAAFDQLDDELTAEEMTSISQMLELSDFHHLQCEVIHSFARELKRNSTEIPKAAVYALEEWIK